MNPSISAQRAKRAQERLFNDQVQDMKDMIAYHQGEISQINKDLEHIGYQHPQMAEGPRRVTLGEWIKELNAQGQVVVDDDSYNELKLENSKLTMAHSKLHNELTLKNRLLDEANEQIKALKQIVKRQALSIKKQGQILNKKRPVKTSKKR